MINKRFKTGMPSVLHSAPDFILSGAPFSVTAAYRDFGENSPEKLCFKADGGKEYFLYPIIASNTCCAFCISAGENAHSFTSIS